MDPHDEQKRCSYCLRRGHTETQCQHRGPRCSPPDIEDQPPSKRRRTEATSQSSLLSASDRSDEVQVHNGILSMSTMDILRGQEYNPTNKTYTSPSAPAPPGESATQAQYARAIFARMAFELLELPTEMLEQLLGYLQAEIGRRSQQ